MELAGGQNWKNSRLRRILEYLFCLWWVLAKDSTAELGEEYYQFIVRCMGDVLEQLSIISKYSYHNIILYLTKHHSLLQV